jgi:uncharacterized delta-60 repeat protein
MFVRNCIVLLVLCTSLVHTSSQRLLPYVQKGNAKSRHLPFKLRLLNLPAIPTPDSLFSDSLTRSQFPLLNSLRQKLNYAHQTNSPKHQLRYSTPSPQKSPSTIPIANDMSEEWAQRYEFPLQASNDFSNAIATDGEGNIYIAGYSDATYSNGDFLTVKYSPKGDTLWTRRYRGALSEFNEATAIVIDKNANVVVTGYSTTAATHEDYVTMMYDKLGNLQWSARYNGSGDSIDVPTSIGVDSAGNVYVTGYSYDATSDIDYLTIKYNQNGIQQWITRYNGAANGVDVANAMTVTSGGNVYVTGYSDGGGTGFDIATICYTSLGLERWRNKYNGSANGDDVANAICLDPSGNVLIAGSSYGGASGTDYITIKDSSNGNELWSKRYSASGNGNDQATALTVDRSGNIIVTGYSSGAGTSYDYATVKYSKDGDLQVITRYNSGGNGADIATGVVTNSLRDIFVTGYSQIDLGSLFDYVTVVYDSAGNRKNIFRYNGTGGRNDIPTGIVLDYDENVYVTGSSDGNAFDCATVKYSRNIDRSWNVQFNSQPGADTLVAVGADSLGNVYTIGYNQQNMVSVKFDSSRNILWVAVLDTPQHCIPQAVYIDSGGTIYTAGYVPLSDTTSEVFVVKYNSQGTKQWQSIYHGTGDGDDHAVAIAVDKEGQVYVTGSRSTKSTFSDFLTIKYSSDGTQFWVTTFNGLVGRNDAAVAVAVDDQENVYVAGTSIRYNSSNDFTTIKYDSSGTKQWVAYYDGPGDASDFVKAMCIDRNGNCYVTGKSFDALSSTDYATIKYSSSGAQLWVARFTGQGSGVDEPTSIALDPNNNVIVTGYSYSDNSSFDFATLKYDTTGNLLWQAIYRGPAKGIDIPKALAIDRQGNAYVTGITLGSGSSNDIATIKYDSHGIEQWVRVYNGTLSADEDARSIVVRNENVFVGGMTIQELTGSDYLLLRYDANPIELDHWPVRYDGPKVSFSFVNAMVVDSAGNTYLAGGINGTTVDALILKYNASGFLEWSRQYSGGENLYDEAKGIALDKNGNVYVACLTTNLRGNSSIVAIKYTPSGDQKWVRTFNRYGSSENSPIAIAVDGETAIITGYSVGNNSGYDFELVEFLPDGQINWHKEYNGPANGNDLVYAMTVDPHHNIYLTGLTYTSGYFPDFGTVKYSSSGTLLWAVQYDGPVGYDDRARCIVADSAENVYVGGWSVGENIYYDYTLVAYDKRGNEKWVLRNDGPRHTDSELRSLSLDSKGNLYMSGNSYDSLYTNSDMVIVKCDTLGNQLWVASFNGDLNSDDVVGNMTTDKLGNVYLVGKSLGADHTFDIVTLMYDSDGNLVTRARYTGAGNTDDDGRTIALDGSGNVYIAGMSTNGNWSVINTLKYRRQVDGVDDVKKLEVDEFHLSQNYPNPFNPTTMIRFRLPHHSIVSMKVYNLLGQEVATLLNHVSMERGVGGAKFDATNLSSGIYFCRIIAEEDAKGYGGIAARTYTDVKKMVLMK